MAGRRFSGSSLSAQILEELPEMQVDPILGPQHNSWPGNRDPGRIWHQLKAEQGQGHRHLHLVHGKLLPDAVPESGREKELRSGLNPSLGPAHSGPSCMGPAPIPFLPGHTHISTQALLHTLPLTFDKAYSLPGLTPTPTSAVSRPKILLQEGHLPEPHRQVM